MKKLRRAVATTAPIPLSDEVRWKEDLLALIHLLGTMGFPASTCRATLFRAEAAGHFVPGVTLTTPSGSVELTLYSVPGERAAALQVWRAWLATVPKEADGITYEREFFSRLFFDSLAADADFVEGLVKDIEAAGIEIPKLRAYEQSGLSTVPSA